jgi:hypothetical protein
LQAEVCCLSRRQSCGHSNAVELTSHETAVKMFRWEG